MNVPTPKRFREQHREAAVNGRPALSASGHAVEMRLDVSPKRIRNDTAGSNAHTE
jgi:hypothetical protein